MQKTKHILKQLALLLSWLPFVTSVQAGILKIGQPAPQFQLKAHDGSELSLSTRQGNGWTVLYFYPKPLAALPRPVHFVIQFKQSTIKMPRYTGLVPMR